MTGPVGMGKRWSTCEITVGNGQTRTVGLIDVAGGDADTQLDAL